MIRLLIVDDHRAVRLGLVAYFDAQDGIDVVGDAENGRDAVELCGETHPDVVLMDVRMPVMDGIEATRAIKRAHPETRVILLSAYEQEELIESGARAGAHAFVLKGARGADLAEHVRLAGAEAR